MEQGLRRGCVLAPLLFILFAAVINVAYTRFKASWSFGAPEEEKGGWGLGEATAGEPVLATPLWGRFYADDTGVVSQSPEQLRKMMGVIVVVCAAFGLVVSEAKTEVVLV